MQVNRKISIQPLVASPSPRGQVVMEKRRSILLQQSIERRIRPPYDVDVWRSIAPLSGR